MATWSEAWTGWGRSWRMDIGADGIELSSRVAGLFPRRRQRWLLDARVDLWEPWDCDEPQGICIEPVDRLGAEEPSECLGPADPARARALRERATAAIESARAGVPATPHELRCPRLGDAARVVDVDGAERNAQGRIRRAVLLDASIVHGMRLDAGTALVFVSDRWLDPRRDDRLGALELVGELTLPLGLVAPAGTRVGLRPEGDVWTVRGALGPLQIEGFPVDGGASMHFDRRRRIERFTLGAALPIEGFVLPAGSTMHRWEFGLKPVPEWNCELAAALALPELVLEPKDSVTFDAATRRLRAFYPRGPRTFEGKPLGGGPVRLRPDGRVDRKRLA